MIIRFIGQLLEKSAELFQLVATYKSHKSVRALWESQNDADTFPVQVAMLCGATGRRVCCIVCV